MLQTADTPWLVDGVALQTPVTCLNIVLQNSKLFNNSTACMRRVLLEAPEASEGTRGIDSDLHTMALNEHPV